MARGRVAVVAVLLVLCLGAVSAKRELKTAELAQAKASALGAAAQALRAKIPDSVSLQVPTLKAGVKSVRVPAGVPSLKLEPTTKTMSLAKPSVELGKMTVSVPVAQLKWNSKIVTVPTGLKFDVNVPVKDMQLPTINLARQNVDLAVKFGDVATVDLKRASMDQLAATLGQLQSSSDSIAGGARAKLCGTQAAEAGALLSKVTFGAVGKACAALELEQAKVNAGIALVKQALDAKAKMFAQLKGGVIGGGAVAAEATAAAEPMAMAMEAKPCACPKIFAPVCNGKGAKFDNECLAKCSGAKLIQACA